MSVTSAYIKVWVMAFTGGVPVWDSSQWSVENRLVPQRSMQTNGSVGQASFRLLRASRQDDSGAPVVSSWSPIKGQYVAITTQACSVPGAAGSLWVGYIEDFQTITTRNVADAIGSVTARQLGGVLDQVPLANPRIFDLTGASADGIALLSIPTANADGLTQSEVIGNAVDAPAGVQPGGYTRRQWAGKAADCGTSGTNYWSRWSLIDHFIHWNYSPLIPTVALSAASNVQTLLDTAAKEVFKLQGLTLKGLLDLMCGAGRGLRWYISYSGNTWTINILSALDAAVGDIPAATATAVTLANDVSVRLVTSGFDQYDAVEVNGAPIVFGGTISPIDSTADKGWSSTSLTDYLSGASGATGYGSLTASQQIARNRAFRKSGILGDVFTRYVVAQDTADGFRCKNVAGVPVAGSVQVFCPEITWIASVAAIDDSSNMCPYPPEARLLRQLPWAEGVKGDGTDIRDAEQKAKPKYLAPVALSYQILGEADWSDLCNPPFGKWHKPSLGVDSRGPALRVEFEYPEMLAYADWTGSPAITEYDPSLTTAYGASDWRFLVLTVAMQSDQRVKVASYRSGTTSATYRNPLRVSRPDINCWVMRKTTIVGLNIDGTPDEVPADTFVRNDFPVAQKLADELAAFAFRDRTGAVITITQPWSPPAWAGIAALLSTLTEPAGAPAYTLNTPVTSVEQVWDEKAPRLIVITGDPSLPDSTALVPLSPAFGGTVSTAMGCTLPAMVQRLDADVKEVQRAQERVPIITGRLPVPSTAATEYIRARWDVDPTTAFYDASEGQAVDASGSNLSPTKIVWVDSTGSCRPEFFGNVWYEAENIGTETRNFVTRDLYRLVRIAPQSGSGTVVYQVTGLNATATTVVRIEDSGGSAINTTINGSAGTNNFELVGANVAYLRTYDMQRRPLFKSAVGSGNFKYLQIIPDHFQTARRRWGGASNRDASSVTVSIDMYETFDILVTYGRADTFSNDSGLTAGNIILRCHNSGGSIVVDDGHDMGAGIYVKQTAGTADSFANTRDAPVVSPLSIATVVLNNAANTITLGFMNFIATSAGGSQITSIAATASGTGTILFGWSVIGGRPAFTGE